MRDWVQRAIKTSGAFRMQEATLRVSPLDMWLALASVERLLELDEIAEVPRTCWPQYRIFTSPKVNN